MPPAVNIADEIAHPLAVVGNDGVCAGIDMINGDDGNFGTHQGQYAGILKIHRSDANAVHVTVLTMLQVVGSPLAQALADEGDVISFAGGLLTEGREQAGKKSCYVARGFCGP